jgi:hypothetical protein
MIGAIVSGLASQLFVSMEQHDLKKRKQLLLEFLFQFWLGWFYIINNLIIIYNNLTNYYYNNQWTEYSLIRLSLFRTSARNPLNQKKQLLEYQNNLELRDIWWSKLSSIFKCCSFFQQPVSIRYLWQLKTVVFLHSCL